MFTAHRRGSNERHFINYELMRQLQDDGRQYPGADNSGMLDNDTPESFNTRFTRLKDESGLSFEALSDEIYKATGVRVTNAALHKYTKGGNIDEPTLEALAAYFGKTPAWFRYGVEPDPRFKFAVLGEIVASLPEEPQQMVLKLLQYEYSGNAARIVSEPGVSTTYHEFLSRLIADRAEKRRNEKPPPEDTP